MFLVIDFGRQRAYHRAVFALQTVLICGAFFVFLNLSNAEMDNERLFSTRELAQMWNVSETTVKRWADSGGLACTRTPGGHRKFRLEDITDFQRHRGFEATGILLTERWEDPELELCLNKKNFRKVREQILYLALQNQKERIHQLLQRLYLRGMNLVDLYDKILMPVVRSGRDSLKKKELIEGLFRLLHNNLEEAVCYLFPRLLKSRSNGRTALSAALDSCYAIHVNACARILELEGWECLNLGTGVPLDTLSEIVRQEPVNLVSLTCTDPARLKSDLKGLEKLHQTTGDYRIPIILSGPAFDGPSLPQQFSQDDFMADFSSFRKLLRSLNR